MNIQQIAIAGAVLAVVALFLRARSGEVMARVKEDLFSAAGLITTVLHVMIVIGFVTAAVAVQTQVAAMTQGVEKPGKGK